MSTEQENIEILKEAYARWNDSIGGSAEYWLSLMSEAVHLVSLAEGRDGAAFTATCSSRRDVRRYLNGFAAEWEMMHYLVDDYIAQGERVVAIGECAWRNRRTGKVTETPKIDIWRFRDGKIVSMNEYYDTAKVLAAAQPDDERRRTDAITATG